MEEYIKYQPINNIGCLGCVSDGKSTLIEALTNVKTQRHSLEKNNNISIKQGYANMKIWNYKDKFYTTGADKNISGNDENNFELVNHVSFVDCPGHKEFFITLLSSLCLMDSVIIVIAINTPINKKSQLIHQLMAIKLLDIKNIIICLNKIDLVPKSTVLNRKKEVEDIMKIYDISPLIYIPTSFNKKIGLNYLIFHIMKNFNINSYKKKMNEDVLFLVSRTFDINKPGTELDNVKGGVVGGTLLKGTLSLDDTIYIKPGIHELDISLKSKIISLKSEKENLSTIIPGGLVGICTNIDPSYCKNDRLKGCILSTNNNLEIVNEIKIKRCMINLHIYDTWTPIINEKISLLLGVETCEAEIIDIATDNIICKLSKKICIYPNYYIIIYISDPIKILGRGTLNF